MAPKLPVMKCPKNHRLPRKGSLGECTPMRCGDPESKARARMGRLMAPPVVRLPEKEKEIAAIVKHAPEMTLPPGAAMPLAVEGRNEVFEKATFAAGRYYGRRAFLGDAPSDKADEATINAWVDRKAVSLLPSALLEKEWLLKYGDDDQRDKAADSILKMTGRIQREGTVSGGATIVLQVNNGGPQLPFMPREVTIDAKKLP